MVEVWSFGRETAKYTVICSVYIIRVGHNHNHTVCMDGNIGRETAKYTVICSVYIIRVGHNHNYTVCMNGYTGRDATKKKFSCVYTCSVYIYTVG
jgi:hypothetical protein